MKKVYLILFIIGMAFLGVLTILSLIGIICYICTAFNKELLTVSSSILISSISAILTVGALLATIFGNNKLYNIQLEVNETSAKRVLNHMNNTLVLNKVEINQYLQGKEITGRNICTQEIKANKLQMKLYFTMSDLSNLKSIGVREFKLYTRTDKYKCPPLVIKIKSNPTYYEIHSIDKKNFFYEVSTNIEYGVFKKIRLYLLNKGTCEIRTYLDIDIMDIDHRTIRCKKDSMCKFVEFDTKRNMFIFEKI